MIHFEPKYKFLWVYKILITWDSSGLFVGYYPDYENCKWYIELPQPQGSE